MCDAQDPYIRNRRKWDLAWRLLRHGARTQTIVRWTGLSASRIRALVRRHGGEEMPRLLSRPRGKAPYQVGHLVRSPRKRMEAGRFAQVWLEIGIGVAARRSPDLPDVHRGEMLCQAFEEFQQSHPKASLAIEECMLVEAILQGGSEFSVAVCDHCHAWMLADQLALGPPRCHQCRRPASPLKRPSTDASILRVHPSPVR